MIFRSKAGASWVANNIRILKHVFCCWKISKYQHRPGEGPSQYFLNLFCSFEVSKENISIQKPTRVADQKKDVTCAPPILQDLSKHCQPKPCTTWEISQTYHIHIYIFTIHICLNLPQNGRAHPKTIQKKWEVPI